MRREILKGMKEEFLMKILKNLIILLIVCFCLEGCGVRNSNVKEATLSTIKPINDQASNIITLLEENSEQRNGMMYLTDEAFVTAQKYMREIKPVEKQMTILSKTNATVSIWFLTAETMLIMDHTERRGYVQKDQQLWDIGCVDFKQQQMDSNFSKYIAKDATYMVAKDGTIERWSLGESEVIVKNLPNISVCEEIEIKERANLLLYDKNNYYLCDIQSKEIVKLASGASEQYVIGGTGMYWIDYDQHLYFTSFDDQKAIMENDSAYNLTKEGYYSNGQFIYLD